MILVHGHSWKISESWSDSLCANLAKSGLFKGKYKFIDVRMLLARSLQLTGQKLRAVP
jgi:hypothetical protein